MILGWRLPAWTARTIFRTLYGLRIVGEPEIPAEGPLVYAINHESHLDPPVVGCLRCLRPCYFLARATLFDFRPFGALIRFFGAIPLDRDQGGMSGLRAAVKVLERGGCIMLFPEGTRSKSGVIGRFRPGFALLARKTGATVLPVAVEGLYEIWPPSRRFPRLRGRIRVTFGKPIGADEFLAMSTEAAVDRLKREIVALHATIAFDEDGAEIEDPAPITPSGSERSRPPAG
jgi:1-acyl-sn-glycerol-3-phosphate acyltransferase